MPTENWIQFVDADVFAPGHPERTAIVAMKRRDDLGDICKQVTAQIQQAYTFSNREVGDAGTIPEGLKARAVAIALWRFVSEGIPKNQVMQTPQREAAYKEALSYLEMITKSTIAQVTTPSVGKRPHRFKYQDGI